MELDDKKMRIVFIVYVIVILIYLWYSLRKSNGQVDELLAQSGELNNGLLKTVRDRFEYLENCNQELRSENIDLETKLVLLKDKPPVAPKTKTTRKK